MHEPSQAMQDAEAALRDMASGAPHPGWAEAMADLRGLLVAIRKLDPSREGGPSEEHYPQRNVFVVQAVAVALAAGLVAGFVADWEEPEGWMVAYIDLPTGQVSWHLPAYQDVYDGHTTEQKYQRVSQFCHPQRWQTIDGIVRYVDPTAGEGTGS